MNPHVQRYSMVIQWSSKDQTYIVEVPELPECMARGKTYERAVKEAQKAIDRCIEKKRELGLPIPAPILAVNF